MTWYHFLRYVLHFPRLVEFCLLFISLGVYKLHFYVSDVSKILYSDFSPLYFNSVENFPPYGLKLLNGYLEANISTFYQEMVIKNMLFLLPCGNWRKPQANSITFSLILIQLHINQVLIYLWFLLFCWISAEIRFLNKQNIYPLTSHQSQSKFVSSSAKSFIGSMTLRRSWSSLG